MGRELSSGLKEMAQSRGIPLQVPQVGSMFCLFFSENPVVQFEDTTQAKHENFNAFFNACLNRGLYLPPSSYETCFISAAHQKIDISKTLEIFEDSFSCFC
jgi:glutamate-1-semialdehyde 2,1-aminomutase